MKASALVLIFIFIILAAGLLFLEKRMGAEGFQNPNSGSYAFPEGVALINLDRRPDRLKSFKDSFDASDAGDRLKFKRVAAVDAKNINIEKYITPTAYNDIQQGRRIMSKNRVSGLDIGVGMTRGGVGCYMSHIEILKFIAGQDKPWIVCEDDAIIPSDLMLRITDLLPKVPYSDKGMILFHAICSNPAENAKALKCTPIGNGVSKTNQFWSTLCYYMPPSTAKILLEHAGTPPYDMEIDAKMGDIAQQGLIDIYVANIVENGWPDSDIQVSAKYYKPTDGGKN